MAEADTTVQFHEDLQDAWREIVSHATTRYARMVDSTEDPEVLRKAIITGKDLVGAGQQAKQQAIQDSWPLVNITFVNGAPVSAQVSAPTPTHGALLPQGDVEDAVLLTPSADLSEDADINADLGLDDE